MTEKKEKRGGKRPGAGRPALNKSKSLIALSAQAHSSLEYYSKELGINKSDLVNSLCILYLDKNNKDILHCPQCGKPLAFEAFLPVIGCDVECTCGYVTYIGEQG